MVPPLAPRIVLQAASATQSEEWYSFSLEEHNGVVMVVARA